MRPENPGKLDWLTEPNEKVTASEIHTTTMPGVEFVLDGVKVSTPTHTFSMGASGQRVLTVTAHFSGTADEECKVTVSGSAGGGTTKTIRQPPNSSFGQRHFTFTVEE